MTFAPERAVHAAALRTGLRALIEREPGGDGGHPASGAAAVCTALVAHFAPLIGERGARTLFARSMVLAQANRPSLASAPSEPGDPPWARILERVEAEPADAALETAAHVISTFLMALGGLIGDALVLRVLRGRWPDVFPADDPEPEDPR